MQEPSSFSRGPRLLDTIPSNTSKKTLTDTFDYSNLNTSLSASPGPFLSRVLVF